MSFKSQDFYDSFMDHFDPLLEKQEYELTTLQEINLERKRFNYSELKPFTFQRVGQTLVFDWKENGWSQSTVDLSKVDDSIALAFAFPLSLAFTFAFAEGKFKKISSCFSRACNIKTVIIDGEE